MTPDDDRPTTPAAEDADRVGDSEAASRYEAFAALARRRADGEMVPLPRMLTGHDRRRHVRQTLREDHQVRISSRSQGAADKFDKLDGSLFSFFRGTCLLFYRDMAGEDAWMPTVLALGDVHPENFGVMPSADNVPMFGPNDFDEAYYAPFTWDLKRGAVGFMIGAEVEGGHGEKRQRKIACAFVEGYVEAIHRYALEATEGHEQTRMDNAPKMIRKLIKGALQNRSEWLAEDYLDEHLAGFRPRKRHVPVSSRREEFQGIVDRFVEENGINVPERAGEMHVKDVCQRLGQGTASLGLPRYYVLIEGPRKDGTDDMILEFKQARRSALSGLVPPSAYEEDGEADRISHAQHVHLVRGDQFYGSASFEGLSFMVRERAPFRDAMDLDDLSKSDWSTYARICGATLAGSHARSDETGRLDYDIEPAIVQAIGRSDLFVDDIVSFALESAARVRADHEHFRADHALGAFLDVDAVFA